MFKFLILSINILLISVTTNAQSLKNTIWKTYNPAIFDTIFVNFHVDSIIQHDSQENLLVASWYQQSGDTVVLLDAAGPFKCPDPDTGWYTVLISGNQLMVNLISDSCDNRAIAYDGVVLDRVDIPTGLLAHNPVEKYFTIKTSWYSGECELDSKVGGGLQVFNPAGQLVLQKQLIPGNHVLTLESGMYIWRFDTVDGKILSGKFQAPDR